MRFPLHSRRETHIAAGSHPRFWRWGEDANGRPLTLLVVERYDGSGNAGVGPRRDWPPSLRVFRAALVEAPLGFGFDFKSEDGPTVKAVDLNKVRSVSYKTYVVDSEEGATREQHEKRGSAVAERAHPNKAAIILHRNRK